tara:strand:+ start:1069 stop:1422 length:354 start_codon:yes stop_codon:yes gene_type:complete
MIVRDLFIGIASFFVAHIITFYQLNGQFISKWFRDNEWIVAATGVIISFFYIWGTKYVVSGMGGEMWPSRFIGFGIGMTIYAIGVSFHFSEGFTPKTWVSLGISLVLICIQVLWKTT